MSERQRLSLYRRPGQRVHLRRANGERIGSLRLVKIAGDRAVFTFELPADIRVQREEVAPQPVPANCDGCGVQAARELKNGLYLCGMCLVAAEYAR